MLLQIVVIFTLAKSQEIIVGAYGLCPSVEICQLAFAMLPLNNTGHASSIEVHVI